MNMRKILQMQRGPSSALLPVDTVSSSAIGRLDRDRTYWLEVYDTKPEARSLSQNALSHPWYVQIGRETGETPLEVKARCKLDYGVPLLRAQDKIFNSWWGPVCTTYPSRAQQLKMMHEIVPITSRLKKAGMTEYLDTVQRVHAEQGIILESKGVES